LVTLDLHRFKEVNDKHGHPRGDDVLRAAAATLKKALRTSDSAFRIAAMSSLYCFRKRILRRRWH